MRVNAQCTDGPGIGPNAVFSELYPDRDRPEARRKDSQARRQVLLKASWITGQVHKLQVPWLLSLKWTRQNDIYPTGKGWAS